MDIAQASPSNSAFASRFTQVDYNRKKSGELRLTAFHKERPLTVTDETTVEVSIYVTTLRVVRQTWEQCHAGLSILYNHRILFQTKDLAKHAGFRDELVRRLRTEDFTLPQVFIGSEYIGGLEVVQSLNEVGLLAQIFKQFEIPPRLTSIMCPSCEDAGLVVCIQCEGTRKSTWVALSRECTFRLRCTHCNKLGLMPCPVCSTPTPTVIGIEKVTT